MEQIPDKRCLVCNEVISNPICPECINKEIRDWLVEKKIELIENNTGLGSTKCIICGKPTAICPSCYTSEIYSIVRKKYPNLEKQFKTYFNFELRHNLVE